MLALKDIEDAFLADQRMNIAGVKTCDTHEREFDEMILEELMPRVPFILTRYGGTKPDEGERHADNSSGIKGREFHLTIGSESLRTKKEAQRGCYDIMDALIERYDGFVLNVGGSSVTLSYDGDDPFFSSKGLVTYRMFFKWTEN
ncbi:MAG: hypothetical protein HYV29_08080 [Ignavibacteriales bacterium]|nr:hypothetical protein [Ignavibacteriales bacterium]